MGAAVEEGKVVASDGAFGNRKMMIAVWEFVRSAIEASVLFAPREPGLTLDELLDVVGSFGFRRGEVSDSLASTAEEQANGRLWVKGGPMEVTSWDPILLPDPRNRAAFGATLEEMKEHARSHGSTVPLARDSLLSRVEQRGFNAHDVEVAVTCFLLGGPLMARGDDIVASPMLTLVDASAFFPRSPRTTSPERRQELLDAVKRVIDGRSSERRSTDPIREFEHQLNRVNAAHLRVWWRNMAAELRALSDVGTPSAVCVACAALMEAALSFCVGFSRARQLPPFKSSDFDKDPTQWRIDQLVKSAGSGQPGAIFDARLAALASSLVRDRQKIHAGRFLQPQPTQPVPTVDTAAAEAARHTAATVVDTIITWLMQHEDDPQLGAGA